MNKKLPIVFLHILCWSLFIMLPLYFSLNAFANIRPETARLFMLPVLVFGMTMVAVFYFNYFYVIPKFLFTKKYFTYIVICFFLVLFTVKVQDIFSYFFGITELRLKLKTDLLFQEIRPLFIINVLLLFSMAFLTSIGLRLNNRWKETEKERLAAQISYLKTQINPHFLFNTLNSIYAITIGKAPQAAEMVDKLSQLMRYSLKETQLDFVLLEKEINYISNYIDLQKVRFDDSVKLKFETLGDFDHNEISPLLLIPFIENAFKHGINSEEDSDIFIKIEVNNNELHLMVNNKKVDVEISSEEKSEIGIENTKHRLKLIYPEKHLLKITDTDDNFNVSLRINLL